MPDIKYVCLSDTHFGASNSLLTNLKTASSDPDPLQPSPVLRQLVVCLERLVSQNKNKDEKPTLILNGDILELALATTNQAAMAFVRFVELILPKGGPPLFGNIIFIPGNHDHHLWELARETQYLNHIANIQPGNLLDIPWHATSMFDKPNTISVPECFLSRLVARLPHLGRLKGLKNLENVAALKRTMPLITTFYPNFGLRSARGNRCLVFHHGHFAEPLYHLMSRLKTMVFPHRKPPTQAWDIEAENFAWIDFFWSTMGRSGEAGRDIGLIYEKLRIEKEREKLLKNLAVSLAEEYDLPGWGDRMEAKILEHIFNGIVRQVSGLERLRGGQKPLSDEAQTGLWAYLEGPLKGQILAELGGTMPLDLTFVFGHTHKPFADDLNFAGYPQWVNTYNTGGWVVDTVDPEPLHGAAVVLADKRLNAVSIRMYNEANEPDTCAVHVEQATHQAEPASEFCKQVLKRVDASKDPWRTFSQVAAEAVYKRAQNLRARINSPSG